MQLCPRCLGNIIIPAGSDKKFEGNSLWLGLFDQKSAITVITPIATALKLCIRHTEMGCGVFD
jgi:hypothetical protein